MPAATKRKRGETRKRLLLAASRLLVEGDGHLEMSWLAKAAGVSHGLAYHHFDSKGGLLCAVVNDFYDRVEGAVLMARLDELPDWEQRERERVLRYISFLLTDPLGRVIVTRLAHSPAVMAVEAERWNRLIAAGAKNVAQGQRTGELGATEDSDLVAAMVLGAVRSAVARAIASSSDTLDPQKLTDDIWRFVRDGLRMGPGAEEG